MSECDARRREKKRERDTQRGLTQTSFEKSLKNTRREKKKRRKEEKTRKEEKREEKNWSHQCHLNTSKMKIINEKLLIQAL